MNTKRHLSDNGGIRGHSAGDYFPYLVVGRGNPFKDSFRWEVWHPDGTVLNSFMYVANAIKLACAYARNN